MENDQVGIDWKALELLYHICKAAEGETYKIVWLPAAVKHHSALGGGTSPLTPFRKKFQPTTQKMGARWRQTNRILERLFNEGLITLQPKESIFNAWGTSPRPRPAGTFEAYITRKGTELIDHEMDAGELAGRLVDDGDHIDWSLARAIVLEKPSRASRQKNRFRKENEIWSLRYENGETFTIDDKKRKGLQTIAFLLSYPKRKFWSEEVEMLAGGVADVVDPAMAAQFAELDLHVFTPDDKPIADPQYLRELLDGINTELAIQAELEAEQRPTATRNDMQKSERTLEDLRKGWNDIVALGGRSRPLDREGEKRVQRVRKNVKDAIEEIKKHDPAFAAHLRHTIKMGRTCSYQPGHSKPPDWEM
jgi:hypothetical protein